MKHPVRNVKVQGITNIIYRPHVAPMDHSSKLNSIQSKPNIVQLKDQEFDEKIDTAFQNGLKEGIQQQKSTHDLQIQLRLETLDKIAQELIDARAQVIKSGEEFVVKFAYAIAKKIVDSEIKSDATKILSIVKKTLKRLSGVQKQVVLRMNPADFDLLSGNLDQLLDCATNLKHIDLQADSRIQQGGCYIESDFASIDATLETRLRQIEDVLLDQKLKNETV